MFFSLRLTVLFESGSSGEKRGLSGLRLAERRVYRFFNSLIVRDERYLFVPEFTPTWQKYTFYCLKSFEQIFHYKTL